MGRAFVITAACAAALALSGCGGSRPHRHTSAAWPSHAELSWLERVGAFRRQLDASAAGFGTRAGAARAYARCGARLRAVVRMPTSLRLRPAYAYFADACTLLERVGRSYLHKPSSVLVFGTFTTSAAHAVTRSNVVFGRGLRAAELGANRTLVSRTGIQPASLSYRDPELARAVRGIARGAVTVRCWTLRDWTHLSDELRALNVEPHPQDIVGRADFHTRVIDLRHAICTSIAEARRRSTRPSRAQIEDWGEAVRVLAHEAFHVRGDADEAVTECHAMQLVVATARRLGIPSALAESFRRIVWHEYPFMPALYRTTLCLDGGPFDLRPASHVWP